MGDLPTIESVSTAAEIVDWLKNNPAKEASEVHSSECTTEFLSHAEKILGGCDWSQAEWRPDPEHVLLLFVLLNATRKGNDDAWDNVDVILRLIEMPRMLQEIIEVDLEKGTYRLTVDPDQIKIIGADGKETS